VVGRRVWEHDAAEVAFQSPDHPMARSLNPSQSPDDRITRSPDSSQSPDHPPCGLEPTGGGPMTGSSDAHRSPDDPPCGPEPTGGGPMTRSPDQEKSLASATVEDLEGPWILLKVKALGELIPAAGQRLEEDLDAMRRPNEISACLRQEYGIRLSELEVSRYGAWLPHIRRDALKKAEERAERNVQEARQRLQETRQRAKGRRK
jgi:hypothetical protein